MPTHFKGGLKRLDDSFYEGISYVHWTMCLRDHRTGWLDAGRHLSLRELTLHALAREFLCCPVYCVMPDHAHFLFLGYDVRSQQRRALRWMRAAWNEQLAPDYALQHQPYDHVLRKEDRARDAFAAVASYILHNPVRAGLVEDWSAWLYSGALFPGYPQLDPRKEYFWDNFWKAYHKHLNAG